MLILRTRCCKKLKQKWQYHNRKVSNVPLTDIFKTNRIQCLPLQNIYSKAIAESTGLCRRSTCLAQSSAGTVRQTIYRRPLGLPSHRTHHLEHPAGRFDLCSVPSLSTFRQRVKIFLFQASFPDIIIDSSQIMPIPVPLVDPEVIFTWTTIKMYDWLIDIASNTEKEDKVAVQKKL